MTDIFIFRELVKVILFILLCQIWSKNSSPVNQRVKLHTCNYDCVKLHTRNHLIKVRINVKLTYKVHIYFLKNSKRGNIKQNFKYTRISTFRLNKLTGRANRWWLTGSTPNGYGPVVLSKWSAGFIVQLVSFCSVRKLPIKCKVNRSADCYKGVILHHMQHNQLQNLLIAGMPTRSKDVDRFRETIIVDKSCVDREEPHHSDDVATPNKHAHYLKTSHFN